MKGCAKDGCDNKKKERRWGVSRRNTGDEREEKEEKSAGAEGGKKNTAGRSDGQPLRPNQEGQGGNLPYCPCIANPACRILPIAAMQIFQSVRRGFLIEGTKGNN